MKIENDKILEPLIIAYNNRLVACDKSFFEGIGFLDEVNSKLAMNVDSDGRCNLQWILVNQKRPCLLELAGIGDNLISVLNARLYLHPVSLEKF
jgi:hypothetical protein